MKKAAKKNHTTPENMPCAPDVEKSILGSVLLHNELYFVAVEEGISEQVFTTSINGAVYAALAAMIESDTPADTITVAHELAARIDLVKFGGIGYIVDLTSGCVPIESSVRKQVQILVDLHRRRELIRVLEDINTEAYGDAETTADLISITSDKMLRLQGTGREPLAQLPKEFSARVLADLERDATAERVVIGLPSGIDEFDLMTTGLRPGEITVVGGWSGTGKTSFAIQIAVANALQGTPVAFFSQEMPKEDLLGRIWSLVSGVPYERIRKRIGLSAADLRTLHESQPMIDSLPIYIDDADLEISHLIARAHMYVRQKKVQVTEVDYIQLMRGYPDEKPFDRVTRAAESLRLFGKQTGTHVVEVAQLVKPEGKDPNVIPNRFMLKSSGEIEQAAHTVALTYMPVDTKHGNQPTKKDAIIIDKQRAGGRGWVRVRYNPDTMTYVAREKGGDDQQDMGFTKKKGKQGSGAAQPDGDTDDGNF